jgi:hypothetical protein
MKGSTTITLLGAEAQEKKSHTKSVVLEPNRCPLNSGGWWEPIFLNPSRVLPDSSFVR